MCFLSVRSFVRFFLSRLSRLSLSYTCFKRHKLEEQEGKKKQRERERRRQERKTTESTRARSHLRRERETVFFSLFSLVLEIITQPVSISRVSLERTNERTNRDERERREIQKASECMLFTATTRRESLVAFVVARAAGSRFSRRNHHHQRHRFSAGLFGASRAPPRAKAANKMTKSATKDDDFFWHRRCERLGDVPRRRLLGYEVPKRTTSTLSTTAGEHKQEKEQQQRHLYHHENPKKRAAVLVLLFEKQDGIIRVLLTKRSADMNSHAGQVAFPGGKLDEEDGGDDIECALREAEEEIGLNRDHVKVLTVLPPIVSAGFISVRPVVCTVTDAENFSKMDWLRNQPAEVERTFSVRLDAFLRDDERHTFNDHAWKNAPCAIRVHSFRVDEEEMVERNDGGKSRTSVCWGLTAAVLIETAKIVYDKEPEFERDCVQGGASIWDLVSNKDATGVELRPGVSKM